MNDPASRQHDPLAPLYGKLPGGWECWVGISGILYARKRHSSPPLIERAATAAELAAKVEAAEKRLHR